MIEKWVYKEEISKKLNQNPSQLQGMKELEKQIYKEANIKSKKNGQFY